MAANVLNNPQAVRAGVFVVRAFVKLRQSSRRIENLACASMNSNASYKPMIGRYPH